MLEELLMIRSFFASHGAPSLALESNRYTQLLTEIGESFSKAEAIIVFTAHWESEQIQISSVEGEYETIYDFGGFQKELYEMKYRAKGSPKVAESVAKALKEAGFESSFHYTRGLDHGSWVVLHHLRQEADLPVVQISVNPYLSVKQQYEIGKALTKLNENVVVIGSGASVHNLRMLRWGQVEPEPWAMQFDDWLIEKLQAWDLDALNEYRELAPYSVNAVPSAEHFMPLFIAMGAGDERKEAKLLHRSYDFGNLSYLLFEFD